MRAGQGKIRVLIADDEKNFAKVLKTELAREGHSTEVASDGREALEKLNEQEFDVLILDLKMPKLGGIDVLKEVKKKWVLPPEVIVFTGHGTIPTAVEAMKLGAYTYLTKPCKTAELNLLVKKAYEKQQILRENIYLKTRLGQEKPFPEIVTVSGKIRQILQMVVRIAPTDSSVLITGESGTGKELIAKAIHQHSKRGDKPFLVINCGALQESILESELFGHEKGAFTGAHSAKLGLFEVADKGTLLLDEIGEISNAMQLKLLRVIETGQFFRVGSTRERQVDVRVLSATNKDLQELVKSGRFREDLFYRVNVIPIHIPPLRERPEDVPILTRHFLHVFAPLGKKAISQEAIKFLSRYYWPGNVRELQHVIRRALILSPKDQIEPEDLPLDLQVNRASPGGGTSSGSFSTLGELERAHILRVMEQVEGHRGQAAQILGIDPKTLYRKLLTYRIDIAEPRDSR
ncbi:MAG: sigma-54-dependent Fis family transcriptional regulator [candidate division NC10 bacterium]|nr:sigma-54-dependent Fis family transcriptional regulator [candidate division NC10 bacterium]